MKEARTRTFRSNAGKAAASAGDRARSSSAVRAGSPHRVTARPSAWGANARTSGWSSSTPCASSRRSLITDWRSRPTVWASAGTRNPGAISCVAAAPPTRSRRSSTTVRRPALPRYAAHDQAVVPAADDTASYPSPAAFPRSTSRAAIRPGAPMMPPPGWTEDRTSSRPGIGVRYRAQPRDRPAPEQLLQDSSPWKMLPSDSPNVALHDRAGSAPGDEGSGPGCSGPAPRCVSITASPNASRCASQSERRRQAGTARTGRSSS